MLRAFQCIGSAYDPTLSTFSIRLWNQRGVCAPGHPHVVCEQFHWAHSCPYLMSWTAPRPCWHSLLDLGGRYSVLLYFFLTLKWCSGHKPHASFGGDSLGVRDSRITWVLCFLHSWHKEMDLGKKPKDLSSLYSQTRTANSTSTEHPIFMFVISVSIWRKGSSQLPVGNGSFQELFGTVLVCMSINQSGTVLMMAHRVPLTGNISWHCLIYYHRWSQK